ncbi:unnamed protein product [Caenorhabditis auriculariae]|uniref:Endonuclease/exonuclease/phosphatase domain-containing protein n=1 Tax=Caenorhabditis auriculariae TaxID=2777116 RepID=A0A8S1GU77_9PELO|nr:unnamed protein product [Caenorhabditis auriculariae]
MLEVLSDASTLVASATQSSSTSEIIMTSTKSICALEGIVETSANNLELIEKFIDEFSEGCGDVPILMDPVTDVNHKLQDIERQNFYCASEVGSSIGSPSVDSFSDSEKDPWQGNEDNQTTKKLKHVQQDGPSPPPVGHAPLRYRGLPLPTRGDQISEQQDTIETDYGRATVTVYKPAARLGQTVNFSSSATKSLGRTSAASASSSIARSNTLSTRTKSSTPASASSDSTTFWVTSFWVMGKYATPSIRHGKHGLGTRNDNGERLAELLDSRRLYHGNSLFEKPDQRRWTWKSPNGDTTNEIDHILANRKWSLLDVAVLPSFDVESDHRLVRAKIRLNQKLLKKDYHQPSRPRRPTYDITTLEEKISEHDWQLPDDPTADYESLCNGLIRYLLRRRGEVKRDPQATHLERLTIDKACRMTVQESLANRRRSALLQTAEKRQSLKKKKFELVDERTVMTALKDENGQLKSSRNEMERLTNTNAAFNSIKEVTSQLKDPKLRAHIFEASIIPAISYGTEVWPDTKKNATALRTSYRALERAVIGTTRFEKWKKEPTSIDLCQLSQIRDLEEHIQCGKHRWGGHVIRRQDDRWSTRLTHWIPRNNKRPSTRWTDYFRKNISQPGRHWMTVAQDRAA